MVASVSVTGGGESPWRLWDVCGPAEPGGAAETASRSFTASSETGLTDGKLGAL